MGVLGVSDFTLGGGAEGAGDDFLPTGDFVICGFGGWAGVVAGAGSSIEEVDSTRSAEAANSAALIASDWIISDSLIS